jgi:hypothetical protein
LSVLASGVRYRRAMSTAAGKNLLSKYAIDT